MVQWNLDATKGSGDSLHVFAITRFRCMEVPFHMLYWGETEYRSLYRGLRYMCEGSLRFHCNVSDQFNISLLFKTFQLKKRVTRF